MRRNQLVWPALGALALLATACEHAEEPQPTAPLVLSVVSGSGQTGAAGQELPRPVVVRVTTTIRGYTVGVPRALVNFRVTGGGGSMYAGSSLTDLHGMAQDYWTLGSEPGPNMLEVRSVDPTTAQKEVHGTFTATGVIVGPEVCNGADDNLDGTVDDPTWRYCVGGVPAPNTDGKNACTGGFSDLDGQVANGCERLLGGTWHVTPTLTLSCPFVPLGFGSFSLSQATISGVTPTEFTIRPVVDVSGFFSVPVNPITVPMVPVAGTFAVTAPFILPETESGGATGSATGTIAVSGSFTGPSSLQATIVLNVHGSLTLPLLGDFSGDCDELNTVVTASRTGP